MGIHNRLEEIIEAQRTGGQEHPRRRTLPEMNARAALTVLVVCAILVAGATACGGEGRSESARCDGRSEQPAAEARQEGDTAARCGGGSGRCDG
ncbi:hypothetical protein HPB50_002436 [Hyalomma asiaticum]|uniref:Uncharacterized protein n=1 Tax=Hyalomma asiaticum TaxID=266040 RepID=A0ACB7SFT3_HYAAI|nr:hypothetical protein HPB50_002436 [Hyalomma asiaticum]